MEEGLCWGVGWGGGDCAVSGSEAGGEWVLIGDVGRDCTMN